jgi:hypothetical protein
MGNTANLTSASEILASARESIARGDLTGAVTQARRAFTLERSLAFVQTARAALNDPAVAVVRDVLQHSPRALWPDTTGVLQAIGDLRRALAAAFMECPAEAVPALFECFAKAHETLGAFGASSGDPVEADRPLLQQIAMTADPADPRRLLAGMLYFRPHQITLPRVLDDIPDWLQERFMRFVFDPPIVLNETGELERYYEFLKGWIDYLYATIVGIESPLRPQELPHRAQRAAFYVLRFGHFSRLYSCRSDLLEFHCRYSGILDAAMILMEVRPEHTFVARPPERKRIRVGILNSNYGPSVETAHSIPAFARLDRLHEPSTATDQYCDSCAEHVVALPRNPAEPSGGAAAVRRIRDDDLDVLLTGSNINCSASEVRMLFANRLARIQCAMLGSPSSTGMKQLDVFISGKLSESGNSRERYRERLEMFDGSGFCADYNSMPPPAVPAQFTRRGVGIAENAIVFASGAGVFKLIPEVLSTFTQILKRVPGSILYLYPYSREWGTSGDPVWMFERLISRTASKLDVDASRICVVGGLRSRYDVVSFLRMADIYLDSYLHAGCHTVVDALQAAVPVIAMEGQFQRQRQGLALLRELDLAELIAADEASYIATAVRLAADDIGRRQLSKAIAEKMARVPRFLNQSDYSGQIGEVLERLVANWKPQQSTVA